MAEGMMPGPIHEEEPVGGAASRLGRAWRSAERRMLHLWIGTPLLGGLVFAYLAPSRYADLPSISRTAARFEREGVIVKGELGRKTLRLRMADGRATITCTPIGPASCLYGVELPLRARVRMFLYNGWWMILSVTAADGRVILSEQRMLQWHRTDQRQYDNGTPLRRFMWGVVIGLPFSWLLIAHARWNLRLERRRAERERAENVG